MFFFFCFFFQAEDGIRDLVRSRGLGDVYKRQFHNSLFLFSGRKRDRLKALYWEGDGFVLLYKRLEGSKFQWPRNTQEVKLITPQEFRWLLEGLSIIQPKAVKQIKESKIL